jgi:hypothetical protein
MQTSGEPAWTEEPADHGLNVFAERGELTQAIRRARLRAVGPASSTAHLRSTPSSATSLPWRTPRDSSKRPFRLRPRRGRTPPHAATRRWGGLPRSSARRSGLRRRTTTPAPSARRSSSSAARDPAAADDAGAHRHNVTADGVQATALSRLAPERAVGRVRRSPTRAAPCRSVLVLPAQVVHFSTGLDIGIADSVQLRGPRPAMATTTTSEVAAGRRDEKAHGPCRGPFHTGNDRKVRERADAVRLPETSESPCKSAGLSSSSTRLKIVVSPVRVRVSPSQEVPATTTSPRFLSPLARAVTGAAGFTPLAEPHWGCSLHQNANGERARAAAFA